MQITIPELISRLQEAYDKNPNLVPYICDSEWGHGRADRVKIEKLGGEDILLIDSSET